MHLGPTTGSLTLNPKNLQSQTLIPNLKPRRPHLGTEDQLAGSWCFRLASSSFFWDFSFLMMRCQLSKHHFLLGKDFGPNVCSISFDLEFRPRVWGGSKRARGCSTRSSLSSSSDTRERVGYSQCCINSGAFVGNKLEEKSI